MNASSQLLNKFVRHQLECDTNDAKGVCVRTICCTDQKHKNILCYDDQYNFIHYMVYNACDTIYLLWQLTIDKQWCGPATSNKYPT